MTNTEKLAALNAFRSAEGKAPFADWRSARHQPLLDAYNASLEQFEASEAELAAQTVRPSVEVNEELPVAPVVVETPAPVATPSKPAKANKKVKVTMESRNGVTHPKPNGTCAIAWALFDRLGKDVKNKDAVYEGSKLGINENTIRTQIYRWRTFHGIELQGRK